MKHLIKNCTVIHKGSKYDGKKVNILIKNGIIDKIGLKIEDDQASVIEGKDLYVSSGWVDTGTHLGEPGYEHRETFQTLFAASKAGGFTDIITMPKSVPPIKTRSQIKNLIQAGIENGVDVHPLGALSQDLKGENIGELIDMHEGGAIGFSDGLQSINKSGVLLRAMDYIKAFGGIVLDFPNDESLSNGDLVHEGEISISLGMKGSPSMAETMVVNRDIELLQYTKSRLCLHTISTKESLILIKKSKNAGDNLSVGVSYLNLTKNHSDLTDFDSNLKVKPILRGKKDQQALLKAVTDDTVDYICSNHYPLEIERKHLEYPYASHGAIGLETCFAAMNTETDLDLEKIVVKLTSGPRNVFGIESPKLEEGEAAKLTVFDPSIEWKCTPQTIHSLSKNSPYIGKTLKGKVVAIFNRKNVFTH